MAPPKFADLGKKAKDLFNDDYIFGESKLTIKSKASNGVNFKVEGKKSDKGAVTGLLETKFTTANGLTVKEKWTTANLITAELTLEGKPKGTKFIVEPTFSPNTGFKSWVAKGEYSANNISSDVAVDDKQVALAGVFQHNQYLLGAKGEYDWSKGAFGALRLGAGYVQNDLSVNTAVVKNNSAIDIEGSVHLTHSPTLETAVKFSWRKDTPDTGFEIGSKYSFDKESWVKAKIDKNLSLGLSYGQALRPGVSVILSSRINAAQLNSDAHQIGFGLTFDN